MKRQKLVFSLVVVLITTVLVAGVFTTANAGGGGSSITPGCSSVTAKNYSGSTITATWTRVGGGSGSISQPSGTTVVYPMQPGVYNITVTAPFLYRFSVTVPACGGSTASCPIFMDGRLNNCEPWQTAAVYCQADGSVRVYVPGKPLWTIAFTASLTDIALVSKNPSVNTLIMQGGGARLYRLAGGKFQVVTPGLNPVDGNYNFIFNCPVK